MLRPDGTPPRAAEATALAILAFRGDRKAPLADLGASLLSSYDPAEGWGDGRANLAGLLAVLQLFKDPLPSQVKVALGKLKSQEDELERIDAALAKLVPERDQLAADIQARLQKLSFESELGEG